MKIGIMDSGVGGLSVWKELIRICPSANYVYVADSGYCPYGERSVQYIKDRCDAIFNFLISKGVNAIVIACNTATAAAVEYLRSKYSLPIVGMEPAVKPAALSSKSGVIGVLATKGTFNGSKYLNTLNLFAKDVQVIERVGKGLVELVEAGKQDSPQAMALLSKYILPMMEAGADHIVLGCTHYPFLSPAIEMITEGKIALVNPAPAVARRLCSLLSDSQFNADTVLSDSIRKVANESHFAQEESAGNRTSGSDEFYSTADNINVLNRMTLSIVSSIPGCFRKMSYKQINI